MFAHVTWITAYVPVGSTLAFSPRTKATAKPLNTAECCQNILALLHMCFTNTFCCSMFRNLALLPIFVAISASSYCIWDYDLRVRSCWFNIYFSLFERIRNWREEYHPIHPWWDLLPDFQASAFSHVVSPTLKRPAHSPSLYKGPNSRMGAPPPWLCLTLLISWEYHLTGS